jgi:hypothetical protein
MDRALSGFLSAAVLSLALAPGAAAAEEPPAVPPFHDANAVLVNLTEADVNAILLDAFHAAGGPSFAGTEEKVSSSMTGLHYAAEFREPVLSLGPDGAARLSFGIERADLRVDQIESKLGGTSIRCEGIGAKLDPTRPLDISLDLQFVLENQDVRIVPRGAVLSDARQSFQLVKPRCSSSFVPTWLLWWVGKPRLKKQLDDLDELLLASVRRSVAQLDEREDGLLHRRLPVGSRELLVYPRLLDTGHRSIWMAFGGADAKELLVAASDAPAPAGLTAGRGGSWLAVSESTANAVLELVYGDWTRPTASPRGTLRKVFQSHAVLGLVPGLRKMDDREELGWGVRFGSVPRIEFRQEGDRPIVELHLSGVELEIARGETTLGTLSIDRGTIAAVPRPTPLGGIALDIVRNDWEVSSRGIEFNEPLLAGTIQELIFGELFATRYEPLARGALTVAETHFEPTGFAVVDGYLVIELGRGAPRRTDSPLASR